MADLTFADDFLPVYDVSDGVAAVADADREKVLAGAARCRLAERGAARRLWLGCLARQTQASTIAPPEWPLTVRAAVQSKNEK